MTTETPDPRVWHDLRNNLANVAEWMLANDWPHDEVVRMLHSPWKYDDQWIECLSHAEGERAAAHDAAELDRIRTV
jgi:hypothetical protein